MKVGTLEEKTRMTGIHQAVRKTLDRTKWRRSAILLNVPPAWAYTVREPSDPVGNHPVPSLAGK